MFPGAKTVRSCLRIHVAFLSLGLVSEKFAENIMVNFISEHRFS